MQRVVLAALLALFPLAFGCGSEDAANATAPSEPSAPGLPEPASSEIAPLPSPVTTLPTPGASAPTAPAEGPFSLLFRDDFDTLDTSRWQLMTHSWGGNLALFSTQSPSVENGQLSLRLLDAPAGTMDGGEVKPFLGAEVRSRATLTYGRVRARAKFARAPAVVSALVTIYTPWPADDWNELDIECLGQDPSKAQFNAQVYTGPPTQAPVTTSVSPTQDPHLEALGFDASEDFHEYAMEWTPAGATFWVDGELRYTWTERIELMTRPQNVLLTIWASGSPGWAGAVTEETSGATAVYDWVELWTYDAALDTGSTAAPTAPPASVPAEVQTEGPATALPTTPAPALPPTTTGATGGAGAPEGSGGTAAEGGSAGEATAGAAAGGAGGAVGGAGSAPGDDDDFELLFRDDFDSLDTARWQLMTHSWESNLALFSSESVSVADGEMTLTLLEAPEGTVDDTGASKPYLGAEVRSVQTVEYGRVRARARLARGSAVVSSLVTIYTPWPADDWNELDIEFLGAEPTHVQFNAMVYTGAPQTPPVTTSVTPTQYPTLVDLGVDASLDFHEWTIEWTPESARFYVDGVLRHTWTERIDSMGLPQNVLLTIWASSSPDWAGPVNADTAGASAVYDWVEVYEYVP